MEINLIESKGGLMTNFYEVEYGFDETTYGKLLIKGTSNTNVRKTFKSNMKEEYGMIEGRSYNILHIRKLKDMKKYVIVYTKGITKSIRNYIYAKNKKDALKIYFKTSGRTTDIKKNIEAIEFK